MRALYGAWGAQTHLWNCPGMMMSLESSDGQKWREMMVGWTMDCGRVRLGING